MTAMNYRTDHVAIAILRHDDGIVLVQQQSREHPLPYWVLPGGLVEPGELITEGLIREAQEEAGVQITEIGHLACLSQIERPTACMQTFVYVFDVKGWTGTLECRDPDGLVVAVKLVPTDAACGLLQASPAWPGFRQPILAYVRGEAPAGTTWCYREVGGQQQVFGCYNLRGAG